LTAEDGEGFGLLYHADDTVHASARGKKDEAIEHDGLSEYGDEGVAFARMRGVDGRE
jgi:hypothetical protein